jgi:hypothetical protein
MTVTEQLLNTQYRIASHFMALAETSLPDWGRVRPVLLSAFHKNLLIFFSSLYLTERGFYGPGLTLLRNSFEALMIAKYSVLSQSDTLLDRWKDGKPISMQRDILSHILNPDPSPLANFWKALCEQSHATVYATQPSAAMDEDVETRVFANLVFLNMLLECNYHLLSRFIFTPSLQYYAKSHREIYEIPELRTKIRALFKQSHVVMKQGAIRLVYTYRRQWNLKL